MSSNGFLQESLPSLQPTPEPKLPEWVFKQIFEIETSPNFDGYELSDSETKFFHEELELSKEKCFKLCCYTTEQSKTSLWRFERKKRITASKAHKIKNARTNDTRLKYFLEDSSIDHLPDVRYGIEVEETARKFFSEQLGHEVIQLGLCVKHSKPWLACSPDGAFLDKDGDLCLLEIKSPARCKDAEKCDVDYLDENGLLKEKHAYYTQVQLQLYVCNAKMCYFLVWCPNDIICLEIARNEEFI